MLSGRGIDPDILSAAASHSKTSSSNIPGTTKLQPILISPNPSTNSISVPFMSREIKPRVSIVFFRAKLLFHGHPWACLWSVRCHLEKRLWIQHRFAQKRTLLDGQLTWETNYKLDGEFLIARPHFFQWGLAMKNVRLA